MGKNRNGAHILSTVLIRINYQDQLLFFCDSRSRYVILIRTVVVKKDKRVDGLEIM